MGEPEKRSSVRPVSAPHKSQCPPAPTGQGEALPVGLQASQLSQVRDAVGAGSYRLG